MISFSGADPEHDAEPTTPLCEDTTMDEKSSPIYRSSAMSRHAMEDCSVHAFVDDFGILARRILPPGNRVPSVRAYREGGTCFVAVDWASISAKSSIALTIIVNGKSGFPEKPSDWMEIQVIDMVDALQLIRALTCAAQESSSATVLFRESDPGENGCLRCE